MTRREELNHAPILRAVKKQRVNMGNVDGAIRAVMAGSDLEQGYVVKVNPNPTLPQTSLTNKNALWNAISITNLNKYPDTDLITPYWRLRKKPCTTCDYRIT